MTCGRWDGSIRSAAGAIAVALRMGWAEGTMGGAVNGRLRGVVIRRDPMGGHRVPLTLTIIATTIAWGAWSLVVWGTDPDATGGIGFALFSVTLALAVAGSATIIGLAVRRHAEDRPRAIRIAVRQGALTGLAVTVGVFLQSRDLLTWFNLLALVLALTLLELFMISLRRTRTRASNDREVAA